MMEIKTEKTINGKAVEFLCSASTEIDVYKASLTFELDELYFTKGNEVLFCMHIETGMAQAEGYVSDLSFSLGGL